MRTYNVTSQHQRDIHQHLAQLDDALQAKLGLPDPGPIHLMLTDEEARQIAGVLDAEHPLQAALKTQIETGVDDSDKVIVYHSLHEMKLGPRRYTQKQIAFLENLPARELTVAPLPIEE